MIIHIIGAGLFGAVARDLLRSRGIACQTIDDQRPLSGSYPAGCLTKPSWLTHVPDRTRALELLSTLYGVQELPLRIGPLKVETILHFPPSHILQPPDVLGTVQEVQPDAGRILMSDGRVFEGRVLVAAGVWSTQLLPGHFASNRLTGLQGCSQRFRATIPDALLKVWAPFKQSVAFNIEPGVVWFGDGTALLPGSFNDSHVARSLAHAEDLGLRRSNLLETRIGLRPYVRGHTGWFRRAGARCWVSTGGAKNGVVLAAAQAHQFLMALE